MSIASSGIKSNGLNQLTPLHPKPTPDMTELAAYQNEAIRKLVELKRLKDERKLLDQQIKAVERELAVFHAAGDLEEIKDGDAERTYRYEDNVFVFSPGRITYDFSKCQDVLAAEDNLKECKSVNIALGLAAKKLGNPFWTVK
jgi:hypothetical protein